MDKCQPSVLVKTEFHHRVYLFLGANSGGIFDKVCK